MRTLLLLFTLLGVMLHARALEPVTLQLKWMHQFQFAGYYAAKEKGFYEDAGLNVTIKERDIRFNNIDQVINGEAQYGVSDSVLLLYQARNAPISILAPIFQHSPGVLITLKSSGIDSPYKLAGKDVTFYREDTDGFPILAMLKELNLLDKVNRKIHTLDYNSLVRGETDAHPGYLTNEVYYFQKRGIGVNVINPAHYGFDLYGDMLFTTVDEIQSHPERARRFRDATIKGWQYAFEHKDEIINLIHSKYNPDKSIEHLRYEADALEELVMPSSIPIGTFDSGRLEFISRLFKDHGLIGEEFSVSSQVYLQPKRDELYLTPEEQQWLEEHKVIRLAVDNAWAPFEYVDKEGVYRGIAAEYIGIIEKKLGIRFEIEKRALWTDVVEMVKKRELDMYSCVVETEERQKYVDFTLPYLNFRMVIVTKEEVPFVDGIKELSGKRVAVVRGYATHDTFSKHHPEVELLLVNNNIEGLEAVANGQAYAYVGNVAAISHVFKTEGISNIKISGETPYRFKLAMASRSDWPILQGIIQKTLDSISESKRSEIYNRWITLQYEHGVDYTIMLRIALGVFIVVTLLALYNRKLKRLNSALEKSNQEISQAKSRLIETNQELEISRERAEAAAEAKAQFLANMSHEIRTPMNAILGFLERLERGEHDPERAKQFKIVRDSGQSLVTIINDILDFSKIESGKMELEEIPFNVKELLENATHIFGTIASSKNIRLRSMIGESVPHCMLGDEIRLKQVVFNLMSNAVKFTQEGGSVTLQSHYDTERDAIEVSVRDTGIGIAMENLEKIFETFNQEDSSTTRRFGGTGLGLSISSRLVQMMGGTLQVESELGAGSRFFFALPMKHCEDDSACHVVATPEILPESTALSGRVLIVEDNKTNQLLLSMILDENGVRYDVANDGAEALLQYKNNTYDLIFMDENMPVMNGIEATHHIREYEQSQHRHNVPIVAVTANALASDRQRFLDAGMDEYVSKPYSEEDIAEVLQRFLGATS